MFIPIIENPRMFLFGAIGSTVTEFYQLSDVIDLTGAKSAQIVVRTKGPSSTSAGYSIRAYSVWPSDSADGVMLLDRANALSTALFSSTISPAATSLDWSVDTAVFDNSAGRLPGPYHCRRSPLFRDAECPGRLSNERRHRSHGSLIDDRRRRPSATRLPWRRRWRGRSPHSTVDGSPKHGQHGTGRRRGSEFEVIHVRLQG